MRCIFCKESSEFSNSIEHIVPESLGNKEHVLPKGTICDKCNNYFATKIEKKALETEFFRNLRFRTGLESKKGRTPPGIALFPKTNSAGEVSFQDDNLFGKMDIVVNEETFELILAGKIKQTYIPLNIALPENNQAISRLLAKIAFEFFMQKFLDNKSYLDMLIDAPGINILSNYARFNSKNETWPYSIRKIYGEDERFYLEDGKSVDMVFECDFLSTDAGEMYFVIAFKGIEFVLNLAGPSIDGYIDWLNHNNGISPLYRQGSNFGYDLTPQFLKNEADNLI